MTNEIMSINNFGETKFYKSFGESKEDKTLMYNALKNVDFKIKDFVNKQITMCGIMITSYTTVDKNTDEENTSIENINNENPKMIELPRIVIYDNENKTYGCSSFGILQALTDIVNIFGTPSKDNQITIEVVNVTTKSNNTMLSLKVI